MGVDVNSTVRVFGDNFSIFGSIGSLLKLTALLDGEALLYLQALLR